MSSPGLRIAITGAAGYIGTRLLERLERESQVERVLAMDVRPLPRPYSSKVVFRRNDVTKPLDGVLKADEVDVLVHLAFILEPGHDRDAVRNVNVFGMSNILEAAERARVSHILYFGSTTVYGAHADNPPELIERSPLRPVHGFQYGEDKVASESRLVEYDRGHSDVALTILRGCPVLGPNADNFIARAYSKPFLLGIAGHDPPLQFIHEDDITDVITRCVLERIPGLYNVAGDGVLAWETVCQILGRRLVRLPANLVYGLTHASWALRLQSDASGSGLEFVRYPWIVSTEKIQRELGVRFRYSSEEAVASFALRF